MLEKKKLICTICGKPWTNPISNRCLNPECKGFCTWGYEIGKPLSWTKVNDKWIPTPPSKN